MPILNHLFQHIGFFPHVTRGNTSVQNAYALGFNPVIYAVTRAYQTRHGNGPMTNENIDIAQFIQQNPYEQNADDGHQGKFRRSVLDMDLLLYALHRNGRTDNLVITCLDLISRYMYTLDKKLWIFKTENEFIASIQKLVEPKIPIIWLSRSPFASEMQKYVSMSLQSDSIALEAL